MAVDRVDCSVLLRDGIVVCESDEGDVQEDYSAKASEEIGHTTTSTEWSDRVSGDQVSPHGNALQTHINAVH